MRRWTSNLGCLLMLLGVSTFGPLGAVGTRSANPGQARGTAVVGLASRLAMPATLDYRFPLQSRLARESRTAGGSSPLPGELLIADKFNNRLLLVDARHRVLWQYPGPHRLPPSQPFRVPDDAFFTPDHRAVIATEEDYDTVRLIDFKTGRLLWQYGNPGIPGSGPGYLNGPDDAYWVGGLITVADIRNCRILFLNSRERIVRQYGKPGVCVHDPPHTFDAPNGDTPLPDGGMLVSEIGGSWIDRLDKHGRLVWGVQAPLAYPSDPQLLPHERILVCDYSLPGRVVVLDRKGHILQSFGASSGPNLLNHPSLAISLPNGLIALNDDWNHRVMIADLHTQHILWQYGVTGIYGSGPGYLFNPDGIDFLPEKP